MYLKKIGGVLAQTKNSVIIITGSASNRPEMVLLEA